MLVDSNILVYAINADSSKHKIAKAFLKEFTTDLEVAHQNILESLRVLTHPKFAQVMSVKNAMDAILSITSACRLLSPNYQTVYLTLEMIKKYKLSSDQVFDAYLAATALSNDIDTIATDNVADFKKLKELTIINPFN